MNQPLFKQRSMTYVRPMVVADLPAVLHIDHASYNWPWCREHFRFGDETVRRAVAEIDDKIVGYMVFRRGVTKLDLERLAVAPAHRREGIGATLLKAFLAQLARGYSRAMIVVEERDLAAQLFLRANGIRAVNVLHNYRTGFLAGWDNEDAYLFVARTQPPATAVRDVAHRQGRR